MKRVALVIAGLACATAAHAQAPAASAAPPAAAAEPPRFCALVTKTGDQYAETTVPGFEPALTSLPLPAVVAPGAVMVVCNRTTIIPEVTDYRVLSELRLPLSIRAGRRTVFIGVSGGRLQIGTPDGQTVTPEETKALQDRLDQMQTAMAAKLPQK